MKAWDKGPAGLLAAEDGRAEFVRDRLRQTIHPSCQKEEMMISRHRITRRRFLATTAAASAVTLAPPFIRTASAAG